MKPQVQKKNLQRYPKRVDSFYKTITHIYANSLLLYDDYIYAQEEL